MYVGLSFFLSLFLCQQDYEKTTGPICMKFSVKVWSDHGTTWLHFWSILRTARCRDAEHGDGVCSALAQQLVMIVKMHKKLKRQKNS